MYKHKHDSITTVNNKTSSNRHNTVLRELSLVVAFPGPEQVTLSTNAALRCSHTCLYTYVQTTDTNTHPASQGGLVWQIFQASSYKFDYGYDFRSQKHLLFANVPVIHILQPPSDTSHMARHVEAFSTGSKEKWVQFSNLDPWGL